MFSWDINKAISNFEKHGVSFEEAATIFLDPDGLEFDDVKHSAQERRFLRLGMSIEERVLLVVYTLRREGHEKANDKKQKVSGHKKESIRIISARQASKKERKAYAGL